MEPYREGMPEPDTYKFGNQEYKMNIKDKQEIPMEWGGMLVVYNCIVGGAIDARFIPAIVKGIMDRMEQGPLTGSYARDVRVCIPEALILSNHGIRQKVISSDTK